MEGNGELDVVQLRKMLTSYPLEGSFTDISSMVNAMKRCSLAPGQYCYHRHHRHRHFVIFFPASGMIWTGVVYWQFLGHLESILWLYTATAVVRLLQNKILNAQC